MGRLLLGVLIGPLLFMGVVACLLSFFFMLDSGGLYRWLLVAKPAMMIAGIIAYADAILFGIPLYFYLKKTNRLTLRNILRSGVCVGIATGVLLIGWMDFFAKGLYTGIPATVVFSVIFGLCGWLVAYTIWYIGIRDNLPG